MTTQEVRDLVIKGWKAIEYIDESEELDEAMFWHKLNKFGKWKPVKSSTNSRHYAITLCPSPGTTKKELLNRIKKIYKSKTVSPIYFEYSIEHEDTNIHSHIYLESKNYVRCRDILRFNQSDRTEVKIIKGLEIPKWRNYIAKENEVINPADELPT